MKSTTFCATLLVAVSLAGCGAAIPDPAPLTSAGSPSAALTAAGEAYYSARDAAGLRDAVQAAQTAAPESALYHELAADLAHLEGRWSARFDHLAKAALDRSGDATATLISLLESTIVSYEDTQRLTAVYRGLADDHPDQAVRARASWRLAWQLLQSGHSDDAADAAARIPGVLDLAITGTWDNDQSKGFDTELPPEKGFRAADRYAGSRVEVGWRSGLPTDYRRVYALHAVLTPDQWAVAYGASTVTVPAAGQYELRVTTSDPFKVWVNGAAVFLVRRVERMRFDGFVIGVTLKAGENTILLKSGQRTGGWYLMARLTALGGAGAEGASSAAAAAGPPVEPGTALLVTPEAAVEASVAQHSVGPIRRAMLLTTETRLTQGGSAGVKRAQALSAAAPGSILARLNLANTLWDNSERGRTSDLLSELDEESGDALPLIRMQRARFWIQGKLKRRAREALESIRTANPDLLGPYLRLADLYRDEKWVEDRCHILEEARERWPGVRAFALQHGACRRALGFDDEGKAIYEEILETLPNNPAALNGVYVLAMKQGDHDRAEAIASGQVHLLPHDLIWRLRLSEARRRAGDASGARAALEGALRLDPDNDVVYTRLGSLAYQQGDRDLAVAHWQASLERNPKNEALANRLDFLLGNPEEGWLADAPTEEQLIALVGVRDEVGAPGGADVMNLLDHEVCELNSDGSTSCVVTGIWHAVNDSGRDRLTKRTVRGGNRSRILHAYAVSADGQRLDASSVRDREIRFRGLDVGATVVLQYRVDEPPVGYLKQHLARWWFFQGGRTATLHSQWVLWLPAESPLHETVLAPDVKREERVIGAQKRVSWTAMRVGPLVPEPAMPHPLDTMQHMLVSTVPDWDTFVKWEDELIHDAFRTSPELEALAARVLDGAETPGEKLLRIHDHVMQQVRYQQDYENHIAGVKPHAAPVVVERGYGDCKDKAVLFITLGRIAGLEVHFALVRTRGQGRVRPDVPMQQFNHAIVYVPKQEGIEARFFDPTADALDLDAVREDDQGTLSLVYDPSKREHYWLEIPFEPPDSNWVQVDTTLTATAEGNLEGKTELRLRGQNGSLIRQASRNSQLLAQVVQQLVNTLQPGAEVLDIQVKEAQDLRVPAHVTADFRAQATVRREGKEVAFKALVFRNDKIWALAERVQPLVLGAPSTQRHSVTIELPPRARITSLPREANVVSPCMTMERTVKRTGRTVVIRTTTVTLCERIAPEDYALHRERSREAYRILDDELVIGLR